jgi:hypothetical protein
MLIALLLFMAQEMDPNMPMPGMNMPMKTPKLKAKAEDPDRIAGEGAIQQYLRASGFGGRAEGAVPMPPATRLALDRQAFALFATIRAAQTKAAQLAAIKKLNALGAKFGDKIITADERAAVRRRAGK